MDRTTYVNATQVITYAKGQSGTEIVAVSAHYRV